MEVINQRNNLFKARNILIVIILFHFISNLFWLKKDGGVSYGCHSVWLEKNSFEYSDVLRDKQLSVYEKFWRTLQLLKLSRNGYAFRADNFNLASLFLALPIASNLDGYAKLFLIHIGLFAVFLAMLSALYYLGKFMFNPEVGAWSATIISFYPGIIGLSRKLNSELLVTFFLICSVIIFIRWGHLPRYLRSIFLFLIFVFGVFSGGLFLVFFIPLFLLHMIFSISRNKTKMGDVIDLFIFLILFTAFLNFYFNGEYLKVFLNLMAGLNEAYKNLALRSSSLIGSGHDGIATLFLFAPQDSICPCSQMANVGMNVKTFLFYIMEIIYYTSPLFFLLALMSLPILFKSKEMNLFRRMLIGTWIICSYLLLSLFYIKWGKFITPLLPVLALSSGFFVCVHSGKSRVIKPILFCLGIMTIIYYSYFHASQSIFPESLLENFIAHSPSGSNFTELAQRFASEINNDNTAAYKTVNIYFLDKASSKYRGNWVVDSSLRVENLIRLFIKRNYKIKDFWRLSEDFFADLHNQNFIIIVNEGRIQSLQDYLYNGEAVKENSIKFRVISEKHLSGDFFIYLIKI
jgi:hypothetical protein